MHIPQTFNLSESTSCILALVTGELIAAPKIRISPSFFSAFCITSFWEGKMVRLMLVFSCCAAAAAARNGFFLIYFS